MSETESSKLLTVLERIEARLTAPALPPELQLLTRVEIQRIFKIERRKFFSLNLPRYKHGGVVRYRLSDLPDHIRQHMQTATGQPLEKRPMKRHAA